MKRLGLLFNYDWDALAFARVAADQQAAARYDFDEAGFDLFSFPSNAHLIHFDLRRFAARQARRGARRGWAGVVSHHEQFGALAASLVAEQLGLPGTRPEAVLAAQHKLHARRVLQKVAPEANVGFAELDAQYGAPIPPGLSYPCFAKPVKAAFSVLAREVKSHAELHAHTRFGGRELWVIRRLVEPFEQVLRERLPEAGSAHRLMLEDPVPPSTPQYNLDGWAFDGEVQMLGVVDAVMYPGTQAFMRWEYPSRLAIDIQARARDVARRFLAEIGFTHGFFNMEFFFDAEHDRLTVIEFNPRLASQFSDLYRRVLGADVHAMTLALALGQDPRAVPRTVPTAGAAASLVYRAFPGDATPAMPSASLEARFAQQFANAMLFCYPRQGQALARDFKWLGSWRYGIIHLDGRDEQQLRERCLQASALLGWTAPYADKLIEPSRRAAATPGWGPHPSSMPGVIS